MSELFQANEILKTAIRIEENGIRFYSEAAAATHNSAVKEMFESLAEQEKRHLHDFTALQKEVASQEARESYPGEQEEYLRMLANLHVFTDTEQFNQVMSRAGNELEVITFAQGVEKDSILFYLEMLDFIPESNRSMVQKLISQEREHVRRLGGLKLDLIRQKKK